MSEQKSFTIDPGITQIDHPTGLALIESGKCTLLDVREKEEYDLGFIPTAINLSVNDINEESVKKLLPDKSKPVIVYCRSGRRTKDAARKLLSLGYYYVLDLGGIATWPYLIDYPKDSSNSR